MSSGHHLADDLRKRLVAIESITDLLVDVDR
jgi:hypothetical protein